MGGVGVRAGCQDSSALLMLFQTEVLMSDGDGQAELIWLQLVISAMFLPPHPVV